MKKIAMCADSGWGDLLVNRYRKRRVRKSTQKAETAEVRIGAPRKIAPKKSRKIIPQITDKPSFWASWIARHNPRFEHLKRGWRSMGE